MTNCHSNPVACGSLYLWPLPLWELVTLIRTKKTDSTAACPIAIFNSKKARHPCGQNIQ